MHTVIPTFLIAAALSGLVVAGAPWARRLRATSIDEAIVYVLCAPSLVVAAAGRYAERVRRGSELMGIRNTSDCEERQKT